MVFKPRRRVRQTGRGRLREKKNIGGDGVVQTRVCGKVTKKKRKGRIRTKELR